MYPGMGGKREEKRKIKRGKGGEKGRGPSRTFSRLVAETPKTCQWVFDLSGVGPSPAGLFVVEQTSVILLWSWTVENLADLETPIPKKSYYLSGLSPVRPNDHWNCQDNGNTRAKPPRRQQGSCGSVRRGRERDFYTQRRGARQVEGL